MTTNDAIASRLKIRIALAALWLPLALGASAQVVEPARPQAKQALLDGISAALVESALASGPRSRDAYDAAREHILGSPALAQYEAEMAARHGASCAGLGLERALAALVNDAYAAASGSPERDKAVSYYLSLVQLSCPRRAREDGVLVREVWDTLQAASAARVERHAAYVEEERARARRAEEERVRLAALEAQRAAEAREREERERQAAAEAARLEEQKAAQAAAAAGASIRAGESFGAGTYRCVSGEQVRILHFGAEGEVVELFNVGPAVLGFAGVYTVAGPRILARYVADNAWKIFAGSYEQSVADDFAWKRSAIASQKVTEFTLSAAPGAGLAPSQARTKMLRSGDIGEARKLECRRVDAGEGTAKAAAAHARIAMRYVEREQDRPPPSLAEARIALPREVLVKKAKEVEWFKRSPGLLKMMATDRLLEELRRAGDARCATAKAGFEAAAASAMNAINEIGGSELALSNPRRAEQMAGRQLDTPFEQFIEQAGDDGCLMEESSAVGL